eukprot:5724441-Pyramimonas_sp.AAC.1
MVEISSGSNMHGKWWACERCGQPIAYRDQQQLKALGRLPKRVSLILNFTIAEVIPDPRPQSQWENSPSTKDRLVKPSPVHGENRVGYSRAVADPSKE